MRLQHRIAFKSWLLYNDQRNDRWDFGSGNRARFENLSGRLGWIIDTSSTWALLKYVDGAED